MLLNYFFTILGIYLYAIKEDYELFGRCSHQSTAILAVDFSLDGEWLRASSAAHDLAFYSVDDASHQGLLLCATQCFLTISISACHIILYFVQRSLVFHHNKLVLNLNDCTLKWCKLLGNFPLDGACQPDLYLSLGFTLPSFQLFIRLFIRLYWLLFLYPRLIAYDHG